MREEVKCVWMLSFQPPPSDPDVAPTPWDEFLAAHSPDRWASVCEMWSKRPTNSPTKRCLATPDLQIHCDNCDGPRGFARVDAFEHQGAIPVDNNTTHPVFLRYQCRNCQSYEKIYALLVHRRFGRTSTSSHALKLGEFEPLGPVIPKRLKNFLGEDVDLFKRGVRAEGQSMGIGAFAYYRRVVENRRTQLFNRLISVADKLNETQMSQELLEARNAQRFADSMAKLKGGLPSGLLIDGANPMAILHTALSHNLHNESDEECLLAATLIRTVLSALIERMDALLKNESELSKVLGKLSQIGKGKTKGTS